MLKRNSKVTLIVVFSLLWAMSATGCSGHFSFGGRAQRQAIANDKNLTDEEREEELDPVQSSDDASPVPIYIVLGAVGSLAFAVAIVQKTVEKTGQRRREKKNGARRTPKTAEARAVLKVADAARAPSRESPRTGTSRPTISDPVREPSEVPKATLPTSQSAVDAIRQAERGASFFTSRPLPTESLIEKTVVIGDRFRLVWATPEEADSIDAGRPPLVRAFTYRHKTMPWYEWAGYDPYLHYWPAVAHDWLWLGGKVVASWLSVDKANPAMPGYYGNRPSGRIDWERATRPRHPDDPTERTLLRCTDAKRFIAMKRRKHLRATRTISCGRNVPPVAIPIRPLKLHKRRVKQTETTGRHIYDIDTPPVERHDRRRSMPPALQTHGLAYKRWIGGIRGHAATNRTRRHLSIAIDIASELRPSVGR